MIKMSTNNIVVQTPLLPQAQTHLTSLQLETLRQKLRPGYIIPTSERNFIKSIALADFEALCDKLCEEIHSRPIGILVKEKKVVGMALFALGECSEPQQSFSRQ